MTPSRAVAVVDIGSNSIKLLVAARDEKDDIVTLASRSLDARISDGISEAEPMLGAEGMQRGLDAIVTLLDDARAHDPAEVRLVATSAVRDARNGSEFADRVLQATGHPVRVLTGAEEAALIGRGLTCDAHLRQLQNFYVFDLGGGSLECLAFRGRQLESAGSLQLGCVRLTESLVRKPDRPFSRSPRFRVMQHVHDELVRGPVRFTLPPGSDAVGTGGTMATVRGILAAEQGISFDETDPYVPLTRLRQMLSKLSRLTLDERKQVPGLPPARADIFPTALATLIVVADVVALAGFRHSLFNLRYGVAAEALGLEPRAHS
jgi:exopolyphosphatase/guanosine-5'-triphosphate,3'-diphosphate pyrophosphatase